MAPTHWSQAEGDQREENRDDSVQAAFSSSVRIPTNEELGAEREAGGQNDEPGDGIELERIPPLENAG